MSYALTGTSNDIKFNYMMLLIEQMKNQNPLEPMSNDQMASQMAQFSQLEQLESMNHSFSQVLRGTELGYANGLIGKEVSFIDINTGMEARGKVEEVKTSAEEIMLRIGTREINIHDVYSIR